ncbi:unnamed protein product [Closterium sp. NIES-65]|nr:unnamed protein product [Closterium sp. NIES-65]
MDCSRFLLPLPPSFSPSQPVAHSLTVSSPVPNHRVPSHSSATPVHHIEPLFTALTPSPSCIVPPAERPSQAREQPATSAAEAGGATAAATADAQGSAGLSSSSSSRGKQPVRPFEECEDEDELSWRLPCSTLREIAPFLSPTLLFSRPLSPFLPAFLPQVAPHLIPYLFVSSLKSGPMAEAFPPFPLPFDDCVLAGPLHVPPAAAPDLPPPPFSHPPPLTRHLSPATPHPCPPHTPPPPPAASPVPPAVKPPSRFCKRSLYNPSFHAPSFAMHAPRDSVMQSHPSFAAATRCTSPATTTAASPLTPLLTFALQAAHTPLPLTRCHCPHLPSLRLISSSSLPASSARDDSAASHVAASAWQTAASLLRWPGGHHDPAVLWAAGLSASVLTRALLGGRLYEQSGCAEGSSEEQMGIRGGDGRAGGGEEQVGGSQVVMAAAWEAVRWMAAFCHVAVCDSEGGVTLVKAKEAGGRACGKAGESEENKGGAGSGGGGGRGGGGWGGGEQLGMQAWRRWQRWHALTAATTRPATSCEAQGTGGGGREGGVRAASRAAPSGPHDHSSAAGEARGDGSSSSSSGGCRTEGRAWEGGHEPSVSGLAAAAVRQASLACRLCSRSAPRHSSAPFLTADMPVQEVEAAMKLLVVAALACDGRDGEAVRAEGGLQAVGLVGELEGGEDEVVVGVMGGGGDSDANGEMGADTMLLAHERPHIPHAPYSADVTAWQGADIILFSGLTALVALLHRAQPLPSHPTAVALEPLALTPPPGTLLPDNLIPALTRLLHPASPAGLRCLAARCLSLCRSLPRPPPPSAALPAAAKQPSQHQPSQQQPSQQQPSQQQPYHHPPSLHPPATHTHVAFVLTHPSAPTSTAVASPLRVVAHAAIIAARCPTLLSPLKAPPAPAHASPSAPPHSSTFLPVQEKDGGASGQALVARGGVRAEGEEGVVREVRLGRGVSGETFSQLLEYIYTGQVSLSHWPSKDLLQLAKKCRLDGLVALLRCDWPMWGSDDALGCDLTSALGPAGLPWSDIVLCVPCTRHAPPSPTHQPPASASSHGEEAQHEACGGPDGGGSGEGGGGQGGVWRCVRVVAHRCVLGARSQYLHALLHCGMRESSQHEVQLPPLPLPALIALLRFLYSARVSFLPLPLPPHATRTPTNMSHPTPTTAAASPSRHHSAPVPLSSVRLPPLSLSTCLFSAVHLASLAHQWMLPALHHSALCYVASRLRATWHAPVSGGPCKSAVYGNDGSSSSTGSSTSSGTDWVQEGSVAPWAAAWAAGQWEMVGEAVVRAAWAAGQWEMVGEAVSGLAPWYPAMRHSGCLHRLPPQVQSAVREAHVRLLTARP